jgi:hypothetical protein
LAAEERLKEKRLSKEERRQLYLAIRYSYLRHEELIGTSMNPYFEEAKDFLMEGLSYRLNPYENSAVKEYKINLKPRRNYGAEMERRLNEDF